MNSTHQDIFAAMRRAVEEQERRVTRSQVPNAVSLVPDRTVRTMRRICTRPLPNRPRWGAGAALPTSDLE